MRMRCDRPLVSATCVLVALLGTISFAGCDPAAESGSEAASASSEIRAWPSYRDVPHRICMYQTNTHECARAVEAFQLRHGHPRLARRDSAFVIQLPGGDSAMVEDRPGDRYGVGSVSHSYLGYLPALAQHLLEIQYYEGGDFLLVDATTGRRQEIPSLPRVSPDGRRFAVFSSAMDTYASNALQIWRASETGLRLEWEAGIGRGDDAGVRGGDGAEWGPRDVIWTDREALRVYLEVSGDRAGGVPAGSATLRREDDGWAFERDPADVSGSRDRGAGRNDAPGPPADTPDGDRGVR